MTGQAALNRPPRFGLYLPGCGKYREGRRKAGQAQPRNTPIA